MKKGIKKGHCLIHGKLTPENTIETKEKYGIRKRCKKCRRDKQAIREFNRNLKKTICLKHGMKKDSTTNYQCKKCKAEWKAADKIKNPEKYKKYKARYRAKNEDLYNLRECARQKGITIDDYYRMLADQNGLCAICHKTENRKSRAGKDITRLSIDHCHETGKIRGLLCHNCNTAIGKFHDSVKLLQSAIDYLKRHKDEAR